MPVGEGSSPQRAPCSMRQLAHGPHCCDLKEHVSETCSKPGRFNIFSFSCRALLWHETRTMSGPETPAGGTAGLGTLDVQGVADLLDALELHTVVPCIKVREGGGQGGHCCTCMRAPHD